MFTKLLGYNDKLRKGFICDDELNIETEFIIGELFVDFMNLDLHSFSLFFDEVEKLFDTTYSSKSDEEQTRNTSVNKEAVSSFFEKYPALKKEVINAYIERRKRLLPNSFNYDIDYEEFYPYFNIITPPDATAILESHEFLDDFIKAYDCQKLMHSLASNLSNVHKLNDLTWDFIYKHNNPYIENLSTVLKHPYMQLSNDDSSDYSILNELIPHVLQSQYKDVFIFCFAIDYCSHLNTFTAEQRLYLYNTLHPYNDTLYQNIEIEFILKNKKESNLVNNEQYFQEDEENHFLEWFQQKYSDELIKKIDTSNVQHVQLYDTSTLRNIITVEFHKMLEHNVKIKKCKNCGNYFLLKGDYATDYCDRVPDGEKNTCKKIAAIQARKKKVAKNPILKEYEKAYKRNYARQSSHKISSEEFRIWSEESMKERDKVQALYDAAPSEQIIEDFKKYLGNR